MCMCSARTARKGGVEFCTRANVCRSPVTMNKLPYHRLPEAVLVTYGPRRMLLAARCTVLLWNVSEKVEQKRYHPWKESLHCQCSFKYLLLVVICKVQLFNFLYFFMATDIFFVTAGSSTRVPRFGTFKKNLSIH